jgi:hypothetical protein
MRRLLPLLILCSVGAGAALANDPAAADACAAKLNPDAKSIYTEAAPSMAKPGADMKAVLTRVVMPRVMHGDMTRRTAEPRAQEASECLALMQ